MNENYETIKRILSVNSVPGFPGAADAIRALDAMQSELDTLRAATQEVDDRRGRGGDDASYTVAAVDVAGTVVKSQTFDAGSVQGLSGLRFASSWIVAGRPVIDAGGVVSIRKRCR